MMKPFLFSVLAFATLLTTGCMSDKNSAPGPVIPSGTFTGQFRRVHTSAKTGVRDTAKANIQLVLDIKTGFTVTGDTSTVIAGSHGGYAVDLNYILFNDVTYPASGTPAKTHLSGAYQYYYDGTVFQMVNNSYLDTLSMQYDLKKVN